MPDGLPAYSRVLPEALGRSRPSDGDRWGTAALDADHAGDPPDAADRQDAGIHLDLPNHHQDRFADGAGKWADRAPAYPDAYLLPATFAAAESDAVVPAAARCKPDVVRFAERSCDDPASVGATAHPAADVPA